MDAILSGFLLVAVVLLLIQNPLQSSDLNTEAQKSQDLLNSLNNVMMDEVDGFDVDVQNQTLLRDDISVLDQIGFYWSQNQSDKAEELFLEVSQHIVSDMDNFRLSFGEDNIYVKGVQDGDTAIVHSRMITGIGDESPITGFTSSAYLTRIRDKLTSEYVYFGGFTGQGNITRQLRLPDDYNASQMDEVELKIETPMSFDLVINGVVCRSDIEGEEGVVSSWFLTDCADLFTAGLNDIYFESRSQLNNSYISGGFLRATFKTDELLSQQDEGFERYSFPEIEGYINLFDGFGVQGIINEIDVNINLESEYDIFMNLGGEDLFNSPGSEGVRNLAFSFSDLTLPPTELPLRVGLSNTSEVGSISGTPADTILVTDVSGSMDTCAVVTEEDYCQYEYRWWWFWRTTDCPYTGSCSADECGTGASTRNHQVVPKESCSATQMDVAIEANLEFVDQILGESTAHRLGLTDFSTSANSYLDLTGENAVLKSEIEDYKSGGWTCVCCALNRARMMLEEGDNMPFVVFLGDGEPNTYCGSVDVTTGQGQDSNPDHGSQSVVESYESAQMLCDMGVDLYTIGFGETMSDFGHEVMENMACNSSMYYDATDANEITQVYENITTEILLAANYSGQKIELVGDFNTTRILPDSYVDIYYTPFESIETQGRIEISFEENIFGSGDYCSGEVFIPSDVIISDAKVASYSGDVWTKTVKVSNSEYTDFVAFNLTDFGDDYRQLGDPFQIQIPVERLASGEVNEIELDIGESPFNSTSCNEENTFIYTALLESSTARTQVTDSTQGCTWSIESRDGNVNEVLVPQDYEGDKTCTYTTSDGVSYSSEDSYDVAMAQLLRQLDPDDEKSILVNLNEADLEITLTTLEGVPYLWGPTKAEVEIWR